MCSLNLVLNVLLCVLYVFYCRFYNLICRLLICCVHLYFVLVYVLDDSQFFCMCEMLFLYLFLNGFVMNLVPFPLNLFVVVSWGVLQCVGMFLCGFIFSIAIFYGNLANNVQLFLFLVIQNKVLVDSTVKEIKFCCCSVTWHDVLCNTAVVVVGFRYILNMNCVGFPSIVMSR
jgi:hypothetical protein